MKPPKLGRPSRPAKELPPIGKLLRSLRDDLSVEAAAAKVDKARDWWHRRETGANKIDTDDLSAIAKAFGVRFATDGAGTKII